MGKVYIVGCGPGSPDYLTPIAIQIVRDAEVLVGAPHLLDLFAGCKAEQIVVRTDINKLLDEVEARCLNKKDKKVVVLVSGDPGLCSLAQPILKRLGRDACRVIPGVSSIQTAFARIGVDWFNARIIDAHGQDPQIAPSDLANEEKIAVLAGRAESFGWIVRLANVLEGNHAIFVCENLTLQDERVQEITTADLQTLQASSRTIVLLINRRLL